MSFATIKMVGEDVEVEYEFDAEDLVVMTHNFKELSRIAKREIEEKVLAYIEDQKISSKEADWMSGD
jgi:hypothetical protein